MESYFRIILDNDMFVAADWLLQNAPKMDNSIFSGTSWNLLKPVEILVLRAFAPNGVFVSANREKYLSLVQNQELIDLSNCLFKNDRDFINNLPQELNSYSAQIEVMMELAYKAKIRKK